MPMEIDRKLLKQRAKESMSLSKPAFWIVTAVYLLMTTGLSYLVDLAPDALYLFFYIAFVLYGMVVGFGFHLWALWTARRLDPGLGSLMEGFSVAGRVIVLELSILVRMLGFAMLLAIPVGLVMAVLMTMTADLAAMLCLYFVLLAALVICMEIFSLRYSLAPYLLADYPDLGPGVAIARSVRLTKGWLLELVKLHLSFFGWYALMYGLTFLGMAVGALIGHGVDLSALADSAGLLAQVNSLLAQPLTSLLGTLFSLPVMLYFTPYLEVTLVEFYNARISQPNAMDDPFSNIEMPPL